MRGLALALWAALALYTRGVLGFCRPVQPAGPRAAILQRLWTSATGASLPGLPSIPLQSLRPGYSQKRRAVLRWRISEGRAEIDRLAREVSALDSRLSLTGAAEDARRARVAELRREAGLAETRIRRLKTQLGERGRRRPGLLGDVARYAETLAATEGNSARVLWRALSRPGRDPWDLLRADTESLLRLGSNLTLAGGYLQLRSSSRLAPHAAAIMARAEKLERHAPGILLAVDGHLDLIEPHLDYILDRFDDIEPHLPFVLEHLDVLAPHCGVLLRHLDALLLYADEDETYLPALLPYVAPFAPRLDLLRDHLWLIRPHLRVLLPHLPVLAPVAPRFAPFPAVSANADILLFYLGWTLRVPLLRRLLYLPLLPRLASFLARRLPRRPVRGRTWDYVCDWEGCDMIVRSDVAQRKRAAKRLAPG